MESISRLAALKQKLADQNEIRAKPFPLASLLLLYEISHPKDTYIERMEGFKLLVNWLSPIAIPDGFSPIPKLYISYELHEIAAILGVAPGNINFCYENMLSKSRKY